MSQKVAFGGRIKRESWRNVAYWITINASSFKARIKSRKNFMKFSTYCASSFPYISILQSAFFLSLSLLSFVSGKGNLDLVEAKLLEGLFHTRSLPPTSINDTMSFEGFNFGPAPPWNTPKVDVNRLCLCMHRLIVSFDPILSSLQFLFDRIFWAKRPLVHYWKIRKLSLSFHFIRLKQKMQKREFPLKEKMQTNF